MISNWLWQSILLPLSNLQAHVLYTWPFSPQSSRNTLKLVVIAVKFPRSCCIGISCSYGSCKSDWASISNLDLTWYVWHVVWSCMIPLLRKRSVHPPRHHHSPLHHSSPPQHHYSSPLHHLSPPCRSSPSHQHNPLRHSSRPPYHSSPLRHSSHLLHDKSRSATSDLPQCLNFWHTCSPQPQLKVKCSPHCGHPKNCHLMRSQVKILVRSHTILTFISKNITVFSCNNTPTSTHSPLTPAWKNKLGTSNANCSAATALTSHWRQAMITHLVRLWELAIASVLGRSLFHMLDHSDMSYTQQLRVLAVINVPELLLFQMLAQSPAHCPRALSSANIQLGNYKCIWNTWSH